MRVVSVVSAEIDDGVRRDAVAALAEHGLTVSNAIRILLTHLATDRDFANGLVPTPHGSIETVRSRKWDDFFDRPGIDIEEPDDPPPEMREAF